MSGELKDKIQILRTLQRTWQRTARLLFLAGFLIFAIFVVGSISGEIPLYIQIAIAIGIAVFVSAGVEFSLRARMNSMYSDLLELIDKENELQKMITLDEFPD